MSTKVAKSVSSVAELYSKQCVDWNFEYMKHRKEGAFGPYHVIFYIVEEKQDLPAEPKMPTMEEELELELEGKKEKESQPIEYDEALFGPKYEIVPDADIGKFMAGDPKTHWYGLLPFYAKQVQVLKISGPTVEGDNPKSKMESFIFDMTKVADAKNFQTILDYASSIYTYDMEVAFSLLRRIMDDDALAGIDEQTKKKKYVRQSPWFYTENDMIYWRHRCQDIRSTFATKKMNRGVTIERLMQHHVDDPEQMDSRGGVFLLYQAIMLTYVDHIKWKELPLIRFFTPTSD